MSSKLGCFLFVPIILLIVFALYTGYRYFDYVGLGTAQTEILKNGTQTTAQAEKSDTSLFGLNARNNVKVTYTADYDNKQHEAKTSLSSEDIEELFGNSDKAQIEIYYHKDYPNIVSNQKIVDQYNALSFGIAAYAMIVWIISVTALLFLFKKLVACFKKPTKYYVR